MVNKIKRFSKLKPYSDGYKKGYRYWDWKLMKGRKTKPSTKQMKEWLRAGWGLK